jgi:hypothetical protein
MLADLATTISKINEGKALFLAGDEELLKRLPKGKWIGGTIPYFMDSNGGVASKDKIFVTEAPKECTSASIAWYDERNLDSIVREAPENGFSFVIIPSSSPAHISYAKNAPNYEGMFLKPIIGWIAGVHLNDLGKVSAKVISGASGELSDSKAIAMHVSLPKGKQASIGIINLFRPGKGDAISFEEEGFLVTECIVGGKKVNFVDYLLSRKIDTRLPLVADYSGAMVNVSVQSVDEKKKIVTLYAPVFKDVQYRIAEPVPDYVKSFSASMPPGSVNPAFACNCILNYLYAGLEGKKTGSITGPITFGEIAYQLLNQTLAYLEIKNASN